MSRFTLLSPDDLHPVQSSGEDSPAGRDSLVWTKRCVELFFSTLGLFLLLPVLITIAFLIKADSRGPVLFTQKRRGLHGRPFRIIKFRTLLVLEDGSNIKQVTHSDPRVTRVGIWLRRTSLDELPQLINVLRGEMSFVGPRPHALAHDQVLRGTHTEIQPQAFSEARDYWMGADQRSSRRDASFAGHASTRRFRSLVCCKSVCIARCNDTAP